MKIIFYESEMSFLFRLAQHAESVRGGVGEISPALHAFVVVVSDGGLLRILPHVRVAACPVKFGDFGASCLPVPDAGTLVLRASRPQPLPVSICREKLIQKQAVETFPQLIVSRF